jgi:hypothetical protein
MLLVSPLLLALFFYGWQQYRYLDLGYKMARARSIRQQLIEANDRLTAQRDGLGSLDRIADAARKELGMIDAVPGQSLTFSSQEPSTNPPADNPPAVALAVDE